MTEGRCVSLTKTALLAGEGLLPVAIAQSLAARGNAPTVIALGKASPLLESVAERILPVSQVSMDGIVRMIETEGCTQVILAGAVPKRWIFGGGPVDAKTLEWIRALPSRDDHALLGSIVGFLQSRGLEVVPYRLLIPEALAPEGTIAGRDPTEEEREEIRYGIGIARKIVPLSFGQALAVRAGAVVAVEAMEGTDEMIKRAGRIAAGGTVVKMMRPDQDERFDVPTVGPRTLQCMADAGLGCLAVEAGRTVILDRERFGQLAKDNAISVTGFVP